MGGEWWGISGRGLEGGTRAIKDRADFYFSLLSACVFIVSDQLAGLGVAGQDRTDNRHRDGEHLARRRDGRYGQRGREKGSDSLAIQDRT